eukprot:SAG11_NODE_25147_length_363_cov_0.784091_1_plen_77_part_01
MHAPSEPPPAVHSGRAWHWTESGLRIPSLEVRVALASRGEAGALVVQDRLRRAEQRVVEAALRVRPLQQPARGRAGV